MLEDLTVRERELFDLLLTGVSPKEIAHKLNITVHTVAYHRTKMYNKLGVQSIQELFAKYSTNGKEPPPEAPETKGFSPLLLPEIAYTATARLNYKYSILKFTDERSEVVAVLART